MTPEQKKEILSSKNFNEFCFENCEGCLLEGTQFTQQCADAYYAVNMEAEKAKVEKLKEALKFYAKPESWKNINQYSKSKITKDDEERVGLQYFIGGRIARQTLKEIEE